MRKGTRKAVLAMAAFTLGLAVGWLVGDLLGREERARLQEEIRRNLEEERRSQERVEELRREADRLDRRLGIETDER